MGINVLHGVMFHIRGTAEETAREACVWEPVNVRQGYLQASGTSLLNEVQPAATPKSVRNIRLAKMVS